MNMIEGHSHSFESVGELMMELNIKSKLNVLEVIFSGLKTEEEIRETFKIYCYVLSNHFKDMDGKPKMDLLVPSLKTLAAKAIPLNSETKSLPQELRGFVEGLRKEGIKDPSWDKTLHCQRKETKRSFHYKLEIAGDHLDSRDPEGAHLFDSSKEEYYDRREQRRWRRSNLTFHPDNLSPYFSYDISCPRKFNGNQRLTAKDIEEAAKVVNIFSEEDVARSGPKLWQMQGGSSGGTHTQHEGSSFNLYKAYNKETKTHAQTTMSWDHVNSIQDATEAFVRGIKKNESLPWRNDLFSVSFGIRGESMEELDVVADRIRSFIRISSLSEHLDKDLVDLKCWFSANVETENPSLEVLEKAIQKISFAKVSFDLDLVVPNPNPESQSYKSSMKCIRKRFGDDEEEQPVSVANNKEKKGFFSKLFGKKKQPKRRVPVNHFIAKSKNIWKGESGGPYRPSITIMKHVLPLSSFSDFIPPKDESMNFAKENEEREVWIIELGCKACVSVVSYRPPCDGMGYHAVSNALCCLHKSLLLCNAIHGIPKIDDLSDNTVTSAAASDNVYLWDCMNPPKDDEKWVGLVTPEIFREMMGGMDCGKIISRTCTWEEMSVNQMLATE
eukprot:TRINITY_DN5735_c0_g1_i2.p1 TRINITY_DN5735_c0_g1~~TRINITY_DN5735_c0_g1_i2.p1  ORF type:complete len:682 (+),score=164.17 TRINITY_DN5735_c0_g1_i2:213-2048(+)